jgi:uncharacterized GH25 family protein
MPGPGYVILAARGKAAFAKAIVLAGAADGFYNHRAGLTLEIAPLNDPGTVRSGDSLYVEVLLRNAAAADVRVEISSITNEGRRTKIAGATDARGRIAIPIEGSGRYRLHAVREGMETSLVFEIR